MKTAIWGVFALLAALWTGFVALSAGLLEWLLSALDGGQIGSAAQAMAQWPVPAWVALWVDVGLVQSLQAQWLTTVQWLGDVLPPATDLTGWLVPLLWLVWGVVTLGLLAAAGLGHWLVGRAAWR